MIWWMVANDSLSKLREFSADRDWEQFHAPKNLVMALSGEVGELTEVFQWLTPDESDEIMHEPSLRLSRVIM